MLTVALVVLVIFLFLRNLSATVIPSVAVPLSLVGTFGVMYLLGYSLNNLTLMALTISTGFVVDDAIVMIENITRYIEAGRAAAGKRRSKAPSRSASRSFRLTRFADRGADSAAVHGRYRRAALPRIRRDAGVTILVSAVVSLTLTPMMCAKLLKHRPAGSRDGYIAASERALNAVIGFYGKTLQWVLRHQARPLLVAIATLVATILLYIIVPKGFFPVRTPA